MSVRSILFIPGDSEKKLAKAEGFRADALVLDLEDSVAPARKPYARQLVGEFLASHATPRKARLWVRINPLDHPELFQDLIAIVGGAPDCLMLPKTNGPADVERLGHYLDALEAREGLASGSIRIHSIVTETAVSTFTLGAYAQANLPRLVSMNWGAEDLSAAIGATTNKGEDGNWDFPYQLVRANCLLAAHSARIQAIETLYSDYRDSAGLEQSCALARRQGFTGRIAIHPDQVAIINRAFSPSDAEVEQARRLIAAFEAQPEAGTIGLDGEMYDIPHLNRARHVLANHESLARE